jgi:hypothetical protein
MSESRTEDLASQIQRLADIEAIKTVKHKYIRLVDSKKWDEWRGLFTEDCILNTEGGVHEGPDDIVQGISRSIGNGNTIHRVTMPEITFTGPDTAEVIWGQQDVVSVIHGGQDYSFQGYGYYHEEYVRTPAGWKIRRSRLERRYTTQKGWAETA